MVVCERAFRLKMAGSRETRTTASISAPPGRIPSSGKRHVFPESAMKKKPTCPLCSGLMERHKDVVVSYGTDGTT